MRVFQHRARASASARMSVAASYGPGGRSYPMKNGGVAFMFGGRSKVPTRSVEGRDSLPIDQRERLALAFFEDMTIRRSRSAWLSRCQPSRVESGARSRR